MNHGVPLMTDLDAFFLDEQPFGFEDFQTLEVPDFGHAVYDDGPFSQMPISTPSSGTTTLPANSPSLQEPWPDGISVESSATGSTHTITASPASRHHVVAPKHAGQRLTIPPARHNDSWPQRSSRPSSKRSMGQADRLIQGNRAKPSDRQPRRGRPSERSSCMRCKIKKRRVSCKSSYSTRELTSVKVLWERQNLRFLSVFYVSGALCTRRFQRVTNSTS
jgi:hypothetical protein